MRKYQKYAAALLSLLLILLMPVQVFAAGPIEAEKEAELTLVYCDDDIPLTNVDFNIYQIAAAASSGELILNETCSDYISELPTHDAEQWKALAFTLEGYVLRDKLKPADSGSTDREGVLTFPAEKESLEHGLYLVTGSRCWRNGCYYDAQPFLIMLPAIDTEKNVWDYAVECRVKFDKLPDVSGDEVNHITRKVLKVWQDEGHEDLRPASIEVQLLCDGEVYDTVALSAGNSWRHTWRGLEADHVWKIVEKSIPGNYDVSASKEGITFVLTNYFTEDIDEDEPPLEQPPEEEIPGDDTPAAPPPSEPQLPQTGQLWWPVPALLAAGLLLIVFGLIRRRGEHES
ncbi:MAG: Cna B-type domain-containing protein [Oscillospiraceae bacterium]|nr:Cna B-type domain-containing protein [Oscillospiraceae bacterium]